MLKYVFESTGFVLKSSKPTKNHFCFSSSEAKAVTATIFGLNIPATSKIFSQDRIPIKVYKQKNTRHYWHIEIHEDKSIRTSSQSMLGFFELLISNFTVFSLIWYNPVAFSEFVQNHPVDDLVVNNKDTCTSTWGKQSHRYWFLCWFFNRRFIWSVYISFVKFKHCSLLLSFFFLLSKSSTTFDIIFLSIGETTLSNGFINLEFLTIFNGFNASLAKKLKYYFQNILSEFFNKKTIPLFRIFKRSLLFWFKSFFSGLFISKFGMKSSTCLLLNISCQKSLSRLTLESLSSLSLFLTMLLLSSNLALDCSTQFPISLSF